VRVTQRPGGHVASVDVEPGCPYDDAGKRSVVNAVWRADPLPYKGYEKVFNDTIVITFVPQSQGVGPALP
jgi:colicin import membrane protein